MIAYTANMWPCPADEDLDCIVNCEKCAEKLLVEYEEHIRADERKKVLDEVYAIALNENYDTLIEWLQDNIID